MKKEKKTTAVIYSRVTARTLPSPLHGLSAQAKQCEQYCTESGLAVIAHFDEVGSAKTLPTGSSQLGMAVQKCLETNSVLVVANLNRITRNLNEITGFLREQSATGLVIVSTDSWASKSFTQTLHQALAEAERKAHSERVKAGLRRRKMIQDSTEGTYTSYVKGRNATYKVTSTVPKRGKVINSERL